MTNTASAVPQRQLNSESDRQHNYLHQSTTSYFYVLRNLRQLPLHNVLHSLYLDPIPEMLHKYANGRIARDALRQVRRNPASFGAEDRGIDARISRNVLVQVEHARTSFHKFVEPVAKICGEQRYELNNR